MAHTPLPIHLIPTRGLWPAGSSTVHTRDISPEFGVTFGWVSATASDYAEESGADHAKKFPGSNYGYIQIIPGSGGSAGTSIIYPVDPHHLQTQLKLIKQDHLVDRFNGLVNCFTHRRGRKASSGFFLILKSDLEEMVGSTLNKGLDRLSTKHKIIFKEHKDLESTKKTPTFVSVLDNTVTITDLLFINATAITPTPATTEFTNAQVADTDDHNNQVYLVEFADARAAAELTVVGSSSGPSALAGLHSYQHMSGKSYNIRTPARNPAATSAGTGQQYGISTREYYLSSMESPGGSPNAWTWETMIKDIWDYLPSPPFPASGLLDFTSADFPTVNPENFKFKGISAWEALHEVLDSIFHTVVRKLDGTWMIVGPTKLNNADDSPRGMMATARFHLQKSLNVFDNMYHQIPEKVAVMFPVPQYQMPTTQDINVVTPQDRWEQGSHSYDIELEVNPAGDSPVTNLSPFNKYYPQEGGKGGRSFNDGLYLNNTGIAKPLEGTKVAIHVNMQARFDERDADGSSFWTCGATPGQHGIPANSTNLTSMAEKLRDLYLNYLVHTNQKIQRLYSGYWGFEGTHKLSSITWGDMGDGAFTQIENIPRKATEIAGITGKLKNTPLPIYNRFIWAENKTGSEIAGGTKGTLTTKYGNVTADDTLDWCDSTTVVAHNVNSDAALPNGATGLVMWDEQVRRWVMHPAALQKHVYVKAQEYWQYTGDYPSIATIGTATAWVSVRRLVAGSEVGDAFDVYLNGPPNTDPNVIPNQVFAAAPVESNTGINWVAVSDVHDAAIGTIKMAHYGTGNAPTEAEGWSEVDGTQPTAKTASGQALNFDDRSPFGDAPGTLGGTVDADITTSTVSTTITTSSSGLSTTISPANAGMTSGNAQVVIDKSGDHTVNVAEAGVGAFETVLTDQAVLGGTPEGQHLHPLVEPVYSTGPTVTGHVHAASTTGTFSATTPNHYHAIEQHPTIGISFYERINNANWA